MGGRGELRRIAVETVDEAGVARGPVRVAGVLPTEEVEVRVEHVGKRGVAYARLARVLRAAPERVETRCPHFLDCGGCDLLHAPLSLQHALARGRIARALGLELERVEPVIESPRALGYRALAKLVVGPERILGSYRPRSHEVVSMDGCLVHAPEAEVVVESLRALIREHEGPLESSLPPGTCFARRSRERGDLGVAHAGGGGRPRARRAAVGAGRRFAHRPPRQRLRGRRSAPRRRARGDAPRSRRGPGADRTGLAELALGRLRAGESAGRRSALRAGGRAGRARRQAHRGPLLGIPAGSRSRWRRPGRARSSVWRRARRRWRRRGRRRRRRPASRPARWRRSSYPRGSTRSC